MSSAYASTVLMKMIRRKIQTGRYLRRRLRRDATPLNSITVAMVQEGAKNALLTHTNFSIPWCALDTWLAWNYGIKVASLIMYV